jgi:hypothetical protein
MSSPDFDQYDSELDTTVADGVSAPALTLHGGRRKKAKPATASLPSASKKSEIKTFVDAGASVEAPVFEPPPELAAAISDAQLLELAHKDTIYSNAASSTELPVDTWALYNKPSSAEVPANMCRPLALRIRQHSGSAPIQEYVLRITKDGTWCVDGGLPYTSLSALVKEYRQVAQAMAVIRSLRAPADMPAITDYAWYGREFGDVARGLSKQNSAFLKELMEHGKARGCTLEAVNYDVPHVYLVRLLMGAKAFILGKHNRSKVWFVLDPRSTWVRLSHSLPDVVSTTPINRGD